MSKARVLLAATSCAVLCSCAAFSTIEAYPGPKRAADEVASIRSPAICGSAGCALVVAVDGVAYGSELKGYPNAVNVLPGEHTLKVRCQLYNAYATPVLEETFEAGKVYELGCAVVDRRTVEAYAEEADE